jgi:hypothetical protein
MVGYMGHRRYRIYDPKHLRIFQVRNIVFEEGEPHQTHPVDIEEGDDGPLPCNLSIFEDDVLAHANNPLPRPPSPPANGNDPIPRPSTPPTDGADTY